MRSAADASSRPGRPGQVDVVMPTWNSASRLERALSSVMRNLRPAHIVIVDRDSEDGTREIARRYGAEILTDTVSLGSARMKGVRACGSEWVCFVDDDISVPEGFIEDARSAAEDGVGAVQGAVVSVHQPYRNLLIDEYERRFSGQDTFDLRSGERGLTSATLVRRELIEGMELADMDTWEDWLMTQKVIDSGNRWVVTRPYVDHFHEYEDLARKGGWNAAGILNLARTGRMPLRQALSWYLSTVFEATRNGVDLTVRFRDPSLFFLSTRLVAHILFAPRHLVRVVPRKPHPVRG